MDTTEHWFLMKHEDGTVFGPVAFDALKQWAHEAQISPLDKISSDGTTWQRAPMTHDLGMDYLVEVSPDQFYGPTTLGAIREFLQAGEISADTIVTNCRDGLARAVHEIQELQPPETEERAEPEGRRSQPIRTSIRRSLQQRIRDLEEALLEERRGREEAEALVEKLENRLAQFETE